MLVGGIERGVAGGVAGGVVGGVAGGVALVSCKMTPSELLVTM